MFSPAEISKNYVNVAKSKTSMKWYKSVILAVLAGAFIAFGGAVATFVSTGVATEGLKALVKGAVFPVGLIMVVICGAELFTGNCLLIAPAVNKDIKWTHMLKSWGLVYLGNLIGSILIAVLVVYSHAMGETVAAACVATANAKCSLSFVEGLLRSILCNMLVCLAVWAAMSSRTTGGKILAVFFPVLTFVACGFEHSIADMYYLTAGLLASAEYSVAAPSLSVGNAVLYLLLYTFGNIIGGSLIALAYHFVYRNKRAAEPAAAETAEAEKKESEEK